MGAQARRIAGHEGLRRRRLARTREHGCSDAQGMDMRKVRKLRGSRTPDASQVLLALRGRKMRVPGLSDDFAYFD